VFALVRVLQREKEIDLLQKLAYVITKTEKFHHLPSASWRIRKAGGGASHQKSKGL
jgi:hypothetical protein